MRTTLVVLALGVLLATVSTGATVLAPTASAAGCEVLDDPAQRTDCTVRARARAEAKARVRAKVADAAPGDPTGSTGASRSQAWRDAVAQAEAFDPRDAIKPRPAAAVVGTIWFWLTVRSRLRRRRRGAVAR